jgi:hypothetical protein
MKPSLKPPRDLRGDMPHFILDPPESWKHTQRPIVSTGVTASSSLVESVTFVQPSPKFWEFVKERESAL